MLKLVRIASIAYLQGMKPLFHPQMEQIQPAAVFAALADPIRLAIVLSLADGAEVEARCGSFSDLASPSLLTYHFAKLREAGVTQARAVGTARLISLRREDFDRRFPGLLDSIIETARREPNLPRIADGRLVEDEPA